MEHQPQLQEWLEALAGVVESVDVSLTVQQCLSANLVGVAYADRVAALRDGVPPVQLAQIKDSLAAETRALQKATRTDFVFNSLKTVVSQMLDVPGMDKAGPMNFIEVISPRLVSNDAKRQRFAEAVAALSTLSKMPAPATPEDAVAEFELAEGGIAEHHSFLRGACRYHERAGRVRAVEIDLGSRIAEGVKIDGHGGHVASGEWFSSPSPNSVADTVPFST